MTNTNEHKDLLILSSQYALTMTNKHKSEFLSSIQYTLTNTNDKADNFKNYEIWLYSTDYSLFVTRWRSKIVNLIP